LTNERVDAPLIVIDNYDFKKIKIAPFIVIDEYGR
jgi:hypothetical protein